MKPITWNIGKVNITSITEIEAGTVIQEIIPNATKENISKIPWLKPHFADEENNLKAVVQTFVIQLSDRTIMVDTCVGNSKKRTAIPAWNNLQTDFLHCLEEQGYNQGSIDTLLFTHLHFDHIGWNTMFVGGKWIPTFPQARHLVIEQEFNYWKGRPKEEAEDDHAGINDSVLPILDAGLIDLIPEDHIISDEISLIPTPGHTPGHVSVLIKSEGKQAVITGDTIHHPCQIAYPEWESFDTDKQKALVSRRNLLERFVDTETLIIGSHFASPTAGYLQRTGDGFKLAV